MIKLFMIKLLTALSVVSKGQHLFICLPSLVEDMINEISGLTTFTFYPLIASYMQS